MSYLVITGCPRSGTKYTATCLQEAGLDVRHEDHGADGLVDWRYALANPSTTPNVFHQTRHPIDAIGSMTTIEERSWQLMYVHGMGQAIGHPVWEAGWAYVYMTDQADAVAGMTYQVERIEQMWDAIVINHGTPDFPDGVSTETNSREHTEVSWEDLEQWPDLCRMIKAKATRYGYTG